ncbi:MAG: InlB B-repeat-containing protein, partial [Paludibacteraceae bacterium]|nr:InlB B-repeat-containing protein [Paludibacteraceae bacterium]
IWHDPYLGTIKAGKIYGLEGDAALADYKPAGYPEANMDKALAENTKVYIDGVLTPSNQLVSERDAYENKLVEVFYEPDFTINSIAVTSVNASDILGDGKVSFDIASSTLYLKTKDASALNTLTGNIVYDGFTLNIIVDGKWRLNGRIVGHDGNLVISAAHPDVMVEEKADLLGIHANATPVSLNGKNFTAKHRVAVYIDDNNNYTQSAVSCGMFAINSAWFDAFGKKPVVDCQNSMIQNANIKTGSLNNDVIQIEPQFTQYYIFVQTNGDERGSVTGEGIYNEGTELTISATPKSGYYFDRWYEDGSTDATRTITVTQNATYTALFFPEEVINYYDVTVLSADETMGTVSGGGTHIEQGQTVTITATPNEGYQFLYWKNAQNQVVPGSEVLNWTVTADEILTAHFRVAPPADAYNLWVCGTRITGSNSNDILGDGVWNYDHENRVLTAMNHATYNISNDGFIQDLESSSGPLTVVLDYNIDVTCTTTDNTIRAALMTMKGMTFTGSTFHGLNLNVKDMNAGNMSDDLTITGHIDFTVFLSTPTTWGQSNINRAFWFSKNFIVNGATVDIGTSESTYKVSNTTNADLQLTNAEINSGAMDQRSLYISDISPKYEINYLTPSLESLCQVGGFNSYFEGTYVTLRAYPAPGYKFVSWSDGNTDNPRYMVMPAQNVYLDPIVEVDESIVPKGAIINANVTEGQGTITNFTSGWYAEGTELTITAQPAEGYEFVQWSDGHETNPYLLTVEDGKNINITAMFCEKGQGIENIQVEGDQPQKIMMDGILYIVREGKIYNAQGANVK